MRAGSISSVVVLALLSLPTLGVEPAPATSGAGARVRLSIGQSVYELGQAIQAELTLDNLSGTWQTIPTGEELAKSLRLTTAAGKELTPQGADRFAATKSSALGPGGFTGISFDASQLFPVLGTTPGRYTISFKNGLLEARIELRTIEAFDPKQTYTLSLNSGAGPLKLELDASSAPVAVRNIVNLARSGFFDNAEVVSVTPGAMALIRGPVTSQHRIVPFEAGSGAPIAGSVVLEPSNSGGVAGSWPNIGVMFAPHPEWQGKVAVIGRLVGSNDTLEKLGKVATSGPEGKPPFKPLGTLRVTDAKVSVAPPAAPSKP